MKNPQTDLEIKDSENVVSDFFESVKKTTDDPIRVGRSLVDTLEWRVTTLLERANKYEEALEFYADYPEILWEPCEDDNLHGLRRQYITATMHPRDVARDALQIKKAN